MILQGLKCYFELGKLISPVPVPNHAAVRGLCVYKVRWQLSWKQHLSWRRSCIFSWSLEKDPKQVAGTHGFGSLCMFIFTDKPAIFAASTSACVCSKTLFQSMPSLEQASSELGNAFNSLVANLKRPWCRRLPFPAQRCIMFSYTFEKQAGTTALLLDSSSADYIPTPTLSGEFTLREFHLPEQPLVLC